MSGELLFFKIGDMFSSYITLNNCEHNIEKWSHYEEET